VPAGQVGQQPGAGGEGDVVAAAAGLVAQRRGQVALPGADGYPRFRLVIAAFWQVMSLLRLM
jgi:hypothetical protein